MNKSPLSTLLAEITVSILRKFAENRPIILHMTCGIRRKRVVIKKTTENEMRLLPLRFPSFVYMLFCWFYCYGTYSPSSQSPMPLWSFDRISALGSAFFVPLPFSFHSTSIVFSPDVAIRQPSVKTVRHSVAGFEYTFFISFFLLSYLLST